jgi:micrococcal nuclease
LVTRVVSGQSVDAVPVSRQNTKPQRIRLIGISSPLTEQKPWGDRARERLEELVKNQTVTFEYDQESSDRLDRPFAYLWQGKNLINAQLVKEGYVLSDPLPPNLKYEPEFNKLQSAARLQELGIWDPQNPMRLTPREYRRQYLR